MMVVVVVIVVVKVVAVVVDCVWNVMAHAQKPDFVFRRNGRAHLNRWGRQFSRLLAAEVCASAVVMLDTPCFEVVWRLLATHSIRQFPLHFPSRASPCAITFQLDCTMGHFSLSILQELRQSTFLALCATWTFTHETQIGLTPNRKHTLLPAIASIGFNACSLVQDYERRARIAMV